MACGPGSDTQYYVGTMDGWYQHSNINTAAMVAHVTCFIALFSCTIFLGYESWTQRGPSRKMKFYSGYQEEQNLAFFVNFFATLSYFGKVVADILDQNFANVGPFILGFGNYRYADYMLTCPLLVYDLLYQIRAPYRFSCAALIFSILLSGVVAEFYAVGDPRLVNGAYIWYSFGVFWFIFTYGVVMFIVKKQYARLETLAQGSNAKNALHHLKFAVFTFSMIWIIFPLVWIICPRGLNWIDDNTTEVAHCLCDIIAKSCYGFALARFRRVYDEELFQMIEVLGYGEDEFDKVEKDMRLSSNGDHIRKLSSSSWESRSDEDLLAATPAALLRKKAEANGQGSSKRGVFVNPTRLPSKPTATASSASQAETAGDQTALDQPKTAWALQGGDNCVVMIGALDDEEPEGVNLPGTPGVQGGQNQNGWANNQSNA